MKPTNAAGSLALLVKLWTWLTDHGHSSGFYVHPSIRIPAVQEYDPAKNNDDNDDDDDSLLYFQATETIEKGVLLLQLPFHAFITPNFRKDEDWSECATAYALQSYNYKYARRERPKSQWDIPKGILAMYLMETYDFDAADNNTTTTESGAMRRPSQWSSETLDWIEEQLGSALVPLPHMVNYRTECFPGDDDDDENEEGWDNIDEEWKVNLQKALEIVYYNKAEGAPRLIPLLDRIAHPTSIEEENVDVIDEDPGNDNFFFKVIAKRTIRPGESLALIRRTAMDSFLATGQIEPYPQYYELIPVVPGNNPPNIVFVIDKYHNDDLPIGVQKETLLEDVHYKVLWESGNPSMHEWNWIQATSKRLQKIELSKTTTGAVDVPENAKEYIKTLAMALKQADLWARGDPYDEFNKLNVVLDTDALDGVDDSERKSCVDEAEDQQCHSVTQQEKPYTVATMYDTLEPLFDDPMPYMSVVSFAWNMNTPRGHDDPGARSVQVETAYQNMNWVHYAYDEERADVCLWLDGFLHSCNSIRPHVHELIIHYPASFLPKNSIKRVLYVGGGDLILLHEIMKYESIELVIGMDLDQAIVRSSFHNFGITPRFDDPRVQWWFGDCTKSLALLPPEEYFGSFDLVVIDLLNFIFDALEVNGIPLVDYLMKMTKSNGILVRQEDFIERCDVDFAKYTVDLDIIDMPHVVEQYFQMGSNGIDFSKQERVDHDIGPTLYYQPMAKNHSLIWHGFRTNVGVGPDFGVDEVSNSTVGQGENRLGVLIIIEAEMVALSLTNIDAVQSKVQEALESSGAKGLTIENSSTEKYGYGTLMFSFNDGYMVIRYWAKHSYCAIDLQLWNSIDKEKVLIESLTRVLGTSWENSSTSSYRITTGGMFGTVLPNQTRTTYPESSGLSKPDNGSSVHTSSVRHPPLDKVPVLLKEMTSLVSENVVAPLVLVLCPASTDRCQAYDALVDSDSDTFKVVSIEFCSGLSSSGQDDERPSTSAMAACEYQVRQFLRESLRDGRKIDGIIVDQDTPIEMGQIIHKIFNSTLIRSKILGDHLTILAPHVRPSEASWRHALMDRFRSSMYLWNPVFHSSVRFGNFIGFEIFSSGDPDFYAHLNEAMANVREHHGLDSELLRSKIGLKTHVPDWEASLVSFNEDYDIEEAEQQWINQHPLAVQVMAQYEFTTKSPIEVGTPVMINIKVGLWDGHWVSGRVIEANNDGTYVVEYGYYIPDANDNGKDLWKPGEVWGGFLYSAGTFPGLPRRTTKDRNLLRPLDDDATTGPLKFPDYVLHRAPDDDPSSIRWYQGYVLDGLRPDGKYKVQCHEGEGFIYHLRRDEIIKRFEPPVLQTPNITKDRLGESFQKSLKSNSESGVLRTRDIGDGCIFSMLLPNGELVVSWNGRNHFDVNIFATEEESIEEIQALAETAIEQSIMTDEVSSRATKFLLSRVQYDKQPRGFGRVVSFVGDIDG